ncbi:uncharacterized protein ALTATR162_LOCUS9281 [Alternaria atra]|uniref:Uncharacterized protein n=1 Tax=Alternaria atra TaxID=119953 RepID=A0A8J2IC29_9PLEO|nr:uncharacterized protein ALTATR162_LOCUS9281 [Alternaria atra]CAG5179456.1 unnamed protein product [Alternaria atra]
MLLLFTNQLSQPGTSVECQGLDEVLQRNNNWLVIHRDGDLSASPPQNISDSLYSFEIEESPRGMMQLPEKLHLGVGGNGIVGRRISVLWDGIEEMFVSDMISILLVSSLSQQGN